MKIVNKFFQLVAMGSTLVGVIVLSACGGSLSSGGTSGGASGNAAASFMKLSKGNTWSYNLTNVLTDGSSNNGTKIRVMYDLTTGGRLLTDTETIATGLVVTPYWFSISANGDVMMTTDPAISPEVYILASPVLNATWTTNGATATVISTTANIIVPAGKFTNCIQVDVVSGAWTGTWYFSSTVGSYVKYINNTANGTHTEELTAYAAN